MTNLTKSAVLAVSLSLLSAAVMLPSALAQTETTSTAKAAAPKKKGASHTKRVKLKKAAAKDIEKGVEKANSNLSK
jgi:hypothetical protein